MNTFFVSLITMDHINFENDVKLVESLGVHGLHIDIMDGHFVPRYGIYPEIVDRVNDVSNLPLDLHMMVNDIFFALEQFKHIKNIEYVRFHIESCIGNEMRVVDKIRDMGAKPIACINLATSFNTISRLVANNEIDGVMLMGIHPGVLIQDSRPNNIVNDLKDLKHVLSGSKADSFIGLDGAVSFETIKPLSDAGINNFIGGSSSIYKGVDRKGAWDSQKEQIITNWEAIRGIIDWKL